MPDIYVIVFMELSTKPACGMAAGAAGRFKRNAARVVRGRALDVPAKAPCPSSASNSSSPYRYA